MKKFLEIALIALLVVSLFTGCGGLGESADEIKIGVNYELSGEVATYGQSSVDGIELAVKQVNEAGGIDGKKIKLVKYDNKSDPSEATSLATKLITQDKVAIVLGPATSGAFKATIPVAMNNNVPVASGSATADDVTVDASGVKDYAFRICFSDSYQGTAMATYAKSKFEATRAAIISDSSSDYAKGLAENFVKQFEGSGGEIVAHESYVSGDTDFNAIITNIKTKNFDILFIPGYYNEAGLIIKQARAQGIDVPVLGADGFDSPILLELAGASALNKVYYSNHYSSLDQDPMVQKFIADYELEYKKAPDAFNALGYDLAMFAIDGITRAGSAEGTAVQAALAGTTDFKGVTGSFSIDENNNPVKAIVVIELTDGVESGSEKIS